MTQNTSTSVVDTDKTFESSQTLDRMAFQTTQKPSVVATELETSFSRSSGNAQPDKNATELPQLAHTSSHRATDDAQVSLVLPGSVLLREQLCRRGISCRNSVHLSVHPPACPSVRHTRAL